MKINFCWLIADSTASFLLRPCLLADSAASLLLLLLPLAIFYPVLSRNAYNKHMIFQHFCLRATQALPYAPYTECMMRISYFCYDRHIFVITSYIASSSSRRCNVMAPSLCPHKSSFPGFFNSKSLHGTAICAIGPLHALHRTIYHPRKLTRSPPRDALSCVLPNLDTLYCL